MNVSYVGDGKVVLIHGNGRSYTDIAAKFCKTEKDLDSIISSSYNKELVRRILNSSHLSATEFDYYIFGVEGYSRVTEIQLVRKRIASYLIKSGRYNKDGKRSYDVVIPDGIEDLSVKVPYNGGIIEINAQTLLEFNEIWYNEGVRLGYKEEDLRYLKPQATEFKAIIGMNAHALIDWFKIRCCLNAQSEIRDMANKMLKICKEVNPDVFKNSGPSCISLGYCPENGGQNVACKGRIYTKDKAMFILNSEKVKETL